MHIYFTSLENPVTVDNILAFLKNYIPHTLSQSGTS